MGIRRGERLGGRYAVEEEIGAGGMGVVVRAKDEKLGRAVAVKVLPAAAVGDAIARERLVREARSAAALEHAGIVRVYDVGETDDGGAFLVMELVRGRSLRDALHEGDMSVADRARAIVEVARALAFAHAAGFVHRDVKPDNVMIRDDGSAMVLDFGLAKPIAPAIAATVAAGDASGRQLTASGTFVGTPAYLAPEQATGETIDARADQFALGVMTYEALAGQLPWRGSTAMAIVTEVLRDEPAPPTSVAEGLPASVDALVMRAMSKKPADRFASAGAFADALEATLPLLDKTRPLGAADPLAATEGCLPHARASTRGGVLTAFGLLGATAMLAAFVAWRMRVSEDAARPARVATSSSSSPSSPSSVGASPLAPLGAVLACVPLRASGIEEPAEWYGAMAATLACHRALAWMGGTSARVLVPAELLGLAAAPTDAFPRDPFAESGAKERTLDAAKSRAAAYLDGEITRSGTESRVTLVLRAKDGHELARGSGAAPIFQKAVRLAMDPILGSALVPRAPESDVAWQAWHRARTAEAAVALVDYAAACSSENRAALAEECERVLARSDLHDDMLTFLRLDCTERQRENLPSIALPKIDHAAAPDLLMDVMLRRFTSDGAQSRAFALELQKALDAEPVRERRALLFAAQAMCFANAGEMRSAHESALAAVHADPKSIDARMFGWHALSFYSPNVMVGPAHSSWVPWEPLAQYATAEGGDTDMRIRAAKRATEVGPRGFWPQALGDLLLRAGKREDARNVAVQSNNDVLRMEILMSEAAFGNALAHAKKIIDEAPATRDGSDRAAGVALYASYAASILGRDADVVEPLVKRYVDAEPPIMSGRVVAFVSLVLACAQAPEPTAKRCVSRLRSLHAKGQLGAAFGGVDMLLAGAERFAARDYAGAAKTWRSATRIGGWMVDQLREPLATALDKSGDAELGESLDALVTATPGLCNGADLAFVRSARRAEKRGDKERAKRLARAIVEAWSVADETVPAVAEMKKMLERLK